MQYNTLLTLLCLTIPAMVLGSTANHGLNAQTPAPTPPEPQLTFTMPFEVPPRPPSMTDPTQERPWFDHFSWQSFIALNWPALIGPDGNPVHGEAAKDKNK